MTDAIFQTKHISEYIEAIKCCIGDARLYHGRTSPLDILKMNRLEGFVDTGKGANNTFNLDLLFCSLVASY